MIGRSHKLTLLLLPVLLAASAAVSFASSEGGDGGYVLGGHGKGIPDPAAGFEHLWRETMIDITVIGVIFSIITLYLMIRYRRRSPEQTGKLKKLTLTQALMWGLVPVFIFMADDIFMAAKGWTLWNDYRRVPAGAYEVDLKSAMWSWNFTHEGGVESTNELRVPAGRPVLVKMTSMDVVHSMFLPDFKVKEDSMPGRITYLWFLPKKPGEYLITCAEYCGVLHSSMMGKVIAMPEGEFFDWLEGEQRKLKGGVES